MRYNKELDKGVFYYVLLIASIVGCYYILEPLFTVIVLSVITVYFVIPVYEWFNKKMHTRLSMLLTWGMIICVVLIPLIILGSIITNQTTTLVTDLASLTDITSLDNFGMIDLINGQLDSISFIDYQIDLRTFQERMQEIASRGSEQITGIVSDIGSSVMSLLTNGLLYIFTVSGLLIGYKELLVFLEDILPLDKKLFALYQRNLGGMSAAMIKATLIIALIQSIITGISFFIVDVPYILLWSVFAFLLGMIPMIGASFIAMPVAIVVALMGNISGAILITLVNQLITNNIDNVLRPKLVDREIKINETLSLLSVFGGLSLFGLLGVIYGPVIMSFALTTFTIYVDDRYL